MTQGSIHIICSADAAFKPANPAAEMLFNIYDSEANHTESQRSNKKGKLGKRNFYRLCLCHNVIVLCPIAHNCIACDVTQFRCL